MRPQHSFPSTVELHIAELAEQLAYNSNRALLPQRRPLSFTSSAARNRVQPSIRRPADFHTLLQSSATSNTLLLTLFKTNTCHSCSQITPLLESVVQNRQQPSPGDTYGSIAFAELELDSPERDDAGGIGWSTMYDVGIEYGVRSVPTLIGFGGRRAERVTDRLSDEKKLRDRQFMENWINEQMSKGDPHPNEGRGLWSRIFGGGS